MRIGITAAEHYLPGEVLTVRKYYTYLQPEIDRLPKEEKDCLMSCAPERVHRLKDPSALEIMGLMAGLKALESSGAVLEEIDGLIVTQTGGKQFMPLIASYLQLNLGLKNGIIARNIGDGDISLLNCINLARVYIKSGLCRKILVVGAAALIGGKYGFGVDLTDPWCIQYGDGAAACIVSAEEKADFEICGYHMETEAVTCRLTGTLNGDYGPIRPPLHRELCFAAEMDDKHGGYLVTHDTKLIEVAGREGFITEVLNNAVKKTGLALSDLDHIIPAHNGELLPVWEKELYAAGVKPGAVKHLQNTVGHAGNADTLIDLSVLKKAGTFARGENIALVMPGSGVQTAVLILKKM